MLILWGQICICAIQIAFCISSPHKHPDDGDDLAVGEYDEDHLNVVVVVDADDRHPDDDD